MKFRKNRIEMRKMDGFEKQDEQEIDKQLVYKQSLYINATATNDYVGKTVWMMEMGDWRSGSVFSIA